MNTVLSTGTRIAGERATGWNRQLRLTPLSTRAYFRTKVVVAYLLAPITIVVPLRVRASRSGCTCPPASGRG